MKSLLLGSAAGFAAVAGAQAADLPARKAAPVEYVRVCSQFGAGYFYIPGTETCLRVSGRVRADYIYNEPFSRSGAVIATVPNGIGGTVQAFSPLTFRARGYLALDSFTATDWGPLRATTRVYVTKDSTSGGGVGNALNPGATTTLDWAYIQWAGITAGRLPLSFFEFAPFGGLSYSGGGVYGRGSDYGSINALAYTATFGGGFSATLSLEDRTERQVALGAVGISPVTGLPVPGISTGVFGVPYGGMTMPDVVGRLEYTSSWGTAMLAGAVHQNRAAGPFSFITGYTAGGAPIYSAVAVSPDTTYGYAIQGGVKVNLGMLAPGDALFLQAAYSNGANSYTGWGQSILGTTVSPSLDVVYGFGGSDSTAKAWSITGGLLHYWLPTFRSAIYGAYGALDHPGSLFDTNAWSIGTKVEWLPVKDFLIGAEIVYTKLDQPNFYRVLPFAPGVPLSAIYNQDDAFQGRIRFQRDF